MPYKLYSYGVHEEHQIYTYALIFLSTGTATG